MDNSSNWKTRTLLMGALIGACTGVLAAYLMIQKAEQQEEQPRLTAGDGVKLGVGVLGLLRFISDMGIRK
ncbi:MAG: hypothetical protein AB9891_15025 [Anaerolineaceae bacterium]